MPRRTAPASNQLLWPLLAAHPPARPLRPRSLQRAEALGSQLQGKEGDIADLKRGVAERDAAAKARDAQVTRTAHGTPARPPYGLGRAHTRLYRVGRAATCALAMKPGGPQGVPAKARGRCFPAACMWAYLLYLQIYLPA